MGPEDGARRLPQVLAGPQPDGFFLWSEVQRRMALQKEPRNETIKGYKARLRRTALAIPEAVVRKAVLDIGARAQAAIEADGGDISRD